MNVMSWPVAVALAGAVLACGSPPAPKAPVADPCGLPEGVKLADLEPQVAGIVMRRLLACNDQRYGRITDAQYRRTVAELDAALAGRPIVVAKHTPKQQPQQAQLINWASSVLDVSSQYSDSSWSAAQVLGPPDVFPAYGDQAKAWASQGADDRDEFIEVGFDQPTSISAVEIYETYNPGAIDRVELVTAKGHRIDAPIGGPAPVVGASAQHRFDVRCTREPIVSVRVHLDSMKVPGWNELDAIGVVPCTP